MCYALVNSKSEHPPSRNPSGFAPIFSQGPKLPSESPGDCLEVEPIIEVPSCQLMPHEGTSQLQTDLPSIAAV